jgi:RES domain-containing protein
VLVWRLALGRHHELDGEGARLYGGRWNSPGIPIVYAATHLSLALLEQLVHVSPQLLPATLRAFAIELPDDVPVETIRLSPPPSDSIACRRYGDIWATARRSAALIVPSVLVPATLEPVTLEPGGIGRAGIGPGGIGPGGIGTDERNVLLNPRHGSAGVWSVVETVFRVDARLKRMQVG